jgi:hypothetical protein
MPLNGKGAARGAIRYVDTIAAFKRAAREGAIDTRATRERRDALKRFYNEGRGRRSGRRKSQIDYETRHGDVVDALDAWREGRTMPVGARIVKNILLDLGVAKGTRLLEAYEVKTSTARQDLYTAIGQLVCHGEGGACRRTIVLPNDMTIAISFARTFAELGIGVLRFQLTSDAARIIDPLA